MLKINPLIATDSYKYSHYLQYPENTTSVFSYIEARGTKIEGVKDVVMFGLQKYIRDVLLVPITAEQVQEAASVAAAHGDPFNYDGWMGVVNRYNGYLPITIRAVPEGTPVPLGNLMVSVTNSDPEMAWLTSFVETQILRSVWYGSTVATVSREIKKIIKEYLVKTSDAPAGELPFKLHDFGARGVSSEESAQIGGAAHLINFLGSDTMSAIPFINHYYPSVTGPISLSIPAAEHSTMTIRGRAGERASYENMIKKFALPGSIFAVVSDSYDIYNAVREIWCRGGLLKQVKDAEATVVIRPDSGDPVRTPVEVLEILLTELADEVIVNRKGYRVLPPYVRVIQGDGIDINEVREILELMEERKISASNIAFGMGGGLLQKVNRDTFKFAMKASYAIVDGVGVDVYKDPVTDPGKRSKRGVLRLVRDDEVKYATVRVDSIVYDKYADADPIVYRMDKTRDEPMVRFYTFDEVRENAALS